MRCALFFIALVAAPLAAQSPAADFDAYVTRGLHDWHVPGLVVAVVTGDSIAFQKAYGVQDITTGKPVDLHTRFAIGSTTKAMTVMALGMLVDEGKVRWDGRVIDYLPNFRLYDPYVTRDIRVRDLLTHRSGLGGEGDLLWVRPDVSEAEIVRRMRYFKPESPFRTRWSYNNIMYQVAGDIVEAASGMTWDRFLTTRIFDPLGMHETIPTVAGSIGQPDVATWHGLVHDSLRVIPVQSTDQIKAAGSVYSSIHDMTLWVKFLLDSGRVNGKRLVSDSVFREIFKSEIPADRAIYPMVSLLQPHFFDYGFGFFLEDYAGYKVAMHTGSIDGMCALIGIVPEKRLGFYVLENVDHAELRHALLYKAIDTWLGTGTRDWSAELYTLLHPHQDKAVAAKDTTPAPASLPLERYTGTYVDSTFGDIIVSMGTAGLRFTYGSSEGTMEHTRYDGFRLHSTTAKHLEGDPVTFAPDGKGGVSGLTFSRIAFTRTPTPAGVAVIQQIHDRYASTWYRSLSFTERADQRSTDGKTTSETWWEEGKFPGRLRIDVGTMATDTVRARRIILFNNDSAFVKAPGGALRRSGRLNMLLVLGFDIYHQPVDRTVAQLTSEGFDLDKVHADRWHGRPATVIGAASGDTTSKQFWIDTERGVFVRMRDGSREAWFDDYRPLAGGWIAAEVGVSNDNVMQLHEVYSNIKANVELPDALFDPARLDR